ncbi:fimbrial protein [Paraherbaspirillum soli]|uniref:Fimbrial protein n=1 Tax=Paraherbaspirillum soli TaxID=631222 RepID=A0ABW0MDR4_9BURK
MKSAEQNTWKKISQTALTVLLATTAIGSEAASVTISITGSITPTTCTVSTSTISFALGAVSVAKFSGIGTGSDWVNRDLTLNCPSITGLNMDLTFTGNSTAGSLRQYFALPSNQGSGLTVASGVAVELSTTNASNGRITATTTLSWRPTSSNSSNNYSYPLYARYVQTGAAVGAGSANASYTMNITYK